MSDFVIRKDIYGSWWHDYNNDATKINISDFEALIDEVQNTFIIQCKNGSNVPTMGVSIVNVKVVNSIISPTPIAFSGAVGLKNLLTTLNYTPYVTAGSGGGAVDSVNGQTGIVIIPIPTNTSDLVNDGENGTDPFITAADVVVPNLEQVTDIGATTTNQITVQNVKIGSNAFGNTIVGQIGTLPTGTFMTAIGYGAGNGSTGQGGTYIGASAGSINFFDKNICLSANANASTGSADNQFVINTNTKNIRFDTNVPLNILFQFPTVGGRFPISVNGNTADSAGNIVVSSGAVDSVNGQTGVVVLDAADVGAEPTKGSDDNYVTDAQLVVIGNTSGTNSGDNATNTKYDVAATTGAVISFATPQVYNSIASPSSSNLTDNLTGARIGIVQKIYHNAGTAPTVPAGWVLRGTGAYVTSTLNIIYAEWSAGTTVEYWITQ